MIYVNTGMEVLPQRCEDCPAVLVEPRTGHIGCHAQVSFNGKARIIFRRQGRGIPSDCPLVAMGFDFSNGEDATVYCGITPDGKVDYAFEEPKGGQGDGGDG